MPVEKEGKEAKEKEDEEKAPFFVAGDGMSVCVSS